MDADAEAAAEPQPAAPLVLDDASLERLAALVWARRPPARSPWQTSLLVMLAGALIAAATAGYFSLRGDIAALGTSLRAENAALETSLRAEIAAVEESLRAELREFRAEFNMVARDHTQRLARLEAAHPPSRCRLAPPLPSRRRASRRSARRSSAHGVARAGPGVNAADAALLACLLGINEE